MANLIHNSKSIMQTTQLKQFNKNLQGPCGPTHLRGAGAPKGLRLWDFRGAIPDLISSRQTLAWTLSKIGIFATGKSEWLSSGPLKVDLYVPGTGAPAFKIFQDLADSSTQKIKPWQPLIRRSVTVQVKHVAQLAKYLLGSKLWICPARSSNIWVLPSNSGVPQVLIVMILS